MRKFLERLDQWKPTTMLKINMGISAFILIAHIGGAFAYLAETEEPKPGIFSLLGTDDLIASLLLITAIIALVKTDILWSTLRIHTIALLVLTVTWIYWGITLAFGNIPEGNFVWNPILFAFLCAYPVYLLRRTFLASNLSKSWVTNYAHVLIAGGSLVLSGIIIYRVTQANV